MLEIFKIQGIMWSLCSGENGEIAREHKCGYTVCSDRQEAFSRFECLKYPEIL